MSSMLANLIIERMEAQSGVVFPEVLKGFTQDSQQMRRRLNFRCGNFCCQRLRQVPTSSYFPKTSAHSGQCRSA